MIATTQAAATKIATNQGINKIGDLINREDHKKELVSSREITQATTEMKVVSEGDFEPSHLLLN